MLCIRPAEIKNLCISNGSVTGYAKNWDEQDISWVFRSLKKDKERAKQLLIWIQNAISSEELRDLKKPESTYLSVFLKKDKFIPKSYDSLLPSSLRKLELVFVSIMHMSKNLSKFNTYAREALWHLFDNHVSPSDRYTIVNYRKRDQPYDQTSPFNIFDKN